ncbi:MAG: hypothetical protein A3K31_15270 [Ignavibacteria bacterium RIFOXYA12_FULL_35_25]|nr:MAG: hypothetical protein A2058_00455 [Ignavibacteria bacterium GWA2_36_19]OGU57803.1 MAG: hypothetical protein A2X60_16250 [Ignavibacteria bacterium GWF2_35_20]OGU89140.1 MAG: hypothetical protein A3K31_15270 [Ignavibacteria bacterium RIFOXYA12_FULL_35_25]OGV29211.1 MAG: hypothetical protein A2523_16795 [Ignavibacteria bacterium RIFOXYD12_FULL_36_8]
MSNALVTGANGFTASHLCRHLIKKGYTVRGLVRKTSNLRLIEGLPIELQYADLAIDKDFSDAMNGIDIVFHVAAAFRVENVPSKYYHEVNIEGTRKLLVAAKKVGIKKFVHTNSVAVQGAIKKPPAKEEDPYNPRNYYHKSKIDGEKLVLEFYQKERMPISVVRPVGIYGPGDTRFLKLFKYINNGKFRMIGSGKVLYHMTYIEDLVRGLILASEKDESVGEIFTIGGAELCTLNQIISKISLLLNKPISKLRIPVWPVWLLGLICEYVFKTAGISPPIYRRRVEFFIDDRAFDISKAKRILGYAPKVSLDEGLKITADWYLKNKWL